MLPLLEALLQASSKVKSFQVIDNGVVKGSGVFFKEVKRLAALIYRSLGKEWG